MIYDDGAFRYYLKKDSTASIKEFTGKATEIFIPKTVTKEGCSYRITKLEIKKNTDSDLNLNGVWFPLDSYVESINYNIIQPNITKFTFPRNLKYLDENWCSKAVNLTEISISSLNKNFLIINKSILMNKDQTILYFVSRHNVEEIRIPRTVTVIQEYAFKNTELSSIIFDKNSVFENIDFLWKYIITPNLKTLVFPPKLRSMPDNWCFTAYNLSEIDISTENENFLVINKMFVYNRDQTILYFVSRKAIKNFIIPGTVREIKQNAFKDTKIRRLSFAGDSKIESISELNIPNSVKNLKLPPKLKTISLNWCFNTPNLEEIDISPENDNFTVLNKSILLSHDRKILYFVVRHSIEEISIPTSVETIKDFAFKDTDLSVIAFQNNSQVRVLGDHFISQCLAHLELPPKLAALPIDCFKKATNLRKIIISPENEHFDVENNSILFNKDRTILYFVSRSYESIIIPKSVIEIKSYAFSSSHIKQVVFEKDSQTHTIGQSAFENCQDLKEIRIPELVTTLAPCCFKASGIKMVFFEGSISMINLNDFQRCSNFVGIIALNSKAINISGKFPSETDGCLMVREGTNFKGQIIADKIHYISPHSINDIDIFTKVKTLREQNKNIKNEMIINKLTKDNEQKQKLQQDAVQKAALYEEENQIFSEMIKSLMNEQNTRKKALQFKDIKYEDIEEMEIVDEFKQDDNVGIKIAKYSTRNPNNISSDFVIKEIKERDPVNKQKLIDTSLLIKDVQKHPCFTKIEKILFNDILRSPTIVSKYYPFSIAEIFLNNDLELTNTKLVIIIVEILFGMRFLQENLKAIHQNIKPENIFLTKNKHVRIGDFGLTPSPENSEILARKGLHSLNFKAPEIAQEKECTNKVDQYAVGVVLYYILTGGKVPFSKIYSITNGNAVKAPASVSDLGREIIQKLCQNNPLQRPSFSLILKMLKKNNYEILPNIEIAELKKRIIYLKQKEKIALL